MRPLHAFHGRPPANGPLAATALAATILAAACQTAQPPAPTGNNVCQLPVSSAALPPALEETSGVAASRAHAGVYWSHNDSGGDPAVFAIDSAGRILAAVRVADAHNRDWEDIAIGPCTPGGPDCLFIAEIGDNSERYGNVAVYRIPEPDPSADSVSPAADIFRFTYPDGPRDAEGVFVNDGGIHVVSKGRSGPIELFRIPPPYQGSRTVQAELVQRLLPPPTSASSQVTAAAWDPERNRVALRTYSGLRFFHTDGDSLAPLGRAADLVAPRQRQGEGIDFLPADRMVATGEARGGEPPRIALLVCDPLRPPADSAEAAP